MPLPDPADSGPDPATTAFAQRLAAWEALHRQQGPGRSYPYAWRLPELARPLGQQPLAQARFALALELYTLGRFREALAALPQADDTTAAAKLRRRLYLLVGIPETKAEEEEGEIVTAELAYLSYLQDRTVPSPDSDWDAPDKPGTLWLTVLKGWSLARRGQASGLMASHRAVAGLRSLAPALCAQAEAIHAEAVFWLGPRWAPVWLDHALDQAELYSQHHIRTRLLALKARALDAAGELGEGARFRKLALALAQRQEARLYLRLFIEPA